MQVVLDCNFVDTMVSDTSHIKMALGYGFFLELMLAEAFMFIDHRAQQQPHQGFHEYQGPHPHVARGA